MMDVFGVLASALGGAVSWALAGLVSAAAWTFEQALSMLLDNMSDWISDRFPPLRAWLAARVSSGVSRRD